MKKTKIWGLASILAAGALLFGVTGCDSGNDEYKDEVPTTYYSYASSGNGAVTAKWTFAEDTDSIGTAETGWAGKSLTPTSGTGAKIIGGDPCAIKWVAPDGTLTEDMGASTGRIQAANKTASLAELGGASLILTTDAQTNITVRAKGAGAATSARILVITNAAGEPLVYKDNLYSSGSTFTAFHVQGAPAGTYTIWFNGSTISEIDCNATGNNVAEPKAYTSNDDLTLNAAPINSLESLVDTYSFKLTDNTSTDVTASAVWTIIEGSDIATVKAGVVSAKSANSSGKVKVRARIGMFYQDSDEFEFTPLVHQVITTFLAKNIPEASTKITDWSTDDGKAVLKTGTSGLEGIVTVADDAVIHIGDILKTTEAVSLADNDVSKGKGIGYQWKDASSSNVEVDTEYISITYTITPVETSAKLVGIYGLAGCGKGEGVLNGQIYIGGQAKGTGFNVKKGQTAPYASTFDAVSITGVTEITLTFETTVGTKKGISLQLQDVGLLFAE